MLKPKKTIRGFIFLTAILQSVQFLCHAQTDWELAKEKQGVKVYTKYVSGCGGLKQFRVIATFTGVNLHEIFAVFKDLPSTPQWTSNLDTCYSIQEVSESYYFNYFLVNVPWPFKDRDAVFEVNAHQNKTDKALHIEARSTPSYIPEREGKVRILDAEGVWKFTPLDNGNVLVDTRLHADPRGFPVWLVNLFAVDSPWETVVKLKKHVKDAKYKGKYYSFISN